MLLEAEPRVSYLGFETVCMISFDEYFVYNENEELYIFILSDNDCLILHYFKSIFNDVGTL